MKKELKYQIIAMVYQNMNKSDAEDTLNLIESYLKNFFKEINWTELSNQKLSLLHILDTDMNEVTKNDLTGILHLLDAIQDFAVDELEFSEKEVFNFNDKDYENN